MKHIGNSKPTHIIISGVESDKYWNIVVDQCGIRNVLMSYHYLQKKGSGFLKERLTKTPDVKILIDSGAHTFYAKIDEFSKKPDSFWEDYLTKYTSWIAENKDYITSCANLDIEGIVGIEKVDEWNKKYFEPLEEIGIDVCYIWHAVRGNNGWEEYCKKHKYVGLSTENDSLTTQHLSKMLTVSKRYNARVHGMALTKTEVLVRVPFYSVDSTTWLVGQQYGELNWFDGRKMKRLSKKDWQRTYKTKLLKEPFNADWDKLINGMGGRGDTYELLRLNVIAYILAEEHIQKRLNAKMYWMNSKPKTQVKSHEEVLKTTPDIEWFEGDCNNYQDYLKVLGIDIDTYTKEEAVDILYYFYMFLNDDEEALALISDEDLIDYANQALETPIATREDALRELKDYFVENALGERDDFKSEAPIQPKERGSYLEDDEFTVIDLTQTDLEKAPMLPQFATGSMPEVEEYDEELAKNGIAVVRDSSGKFVKGQQRVRKPKNIYSEKYPKLVCDTCYKSGDCPQYKAGFVCAFDRTFKKFDSRKVEDLVDGMGSIVEFNMGRLQRAMMFEVMDGGMPTAEVSHLIDQNMKYLEKMKDLMTNSPKAVVEQRKVLKSDGTQEITTSVGVTPQTGGILSQIFGDSNKNSRESSDN